jgi:hypothetical protein
VIGIGNTRIDAESYGAHGMLTLLVQPDAEIAREDHVIRLQSRDQVGAFFRDNRELLQDPRRVQAAARGEEALVGEMGRMMPALHDR